MGFQESDSLAQLSLPPGFRFFPTDEELLVQYLCKKVAGHDFSLQIIREIDLYKFDPWMLPSKAIFGEKEWYFFSPRDRKYPNGSRPNRVAGSGYWKATGTDKIITTQGRRVGIKKALVFYVGKAPKGTKTDWIMHEYRLCVPPRKHGSSRLDDWVLCRIYKKNPSSQLKPPIYNDDDSGQNKEPSNGSPSSSSTSSQLDDVLESLPEIDDRCFSLPRMNSFKAFQQDDQQKLISFQSLNNGCLDWGSLAGLNSVPELPPQPIQLTQQHLNNVVSNNLNNQDDFFMHGHGEGESGMRTTDQRVDDPGSMFNSNAFTQGFRHSVEPFVIQYPNQLGSLGFRN